MRQHCDALAVGPLTNLLACLTACLLPSRALSCLSVVPSLHDLMVRIGDTPPTAGLAAGELISANALCDILIDPLEGSTLDMHCGGPLVGATSCCLPALHAACSACCMLLTGRCGACDSAGLHACLPACLWAARSCRPSS